VLRKETEMVGCVLCKGSEVLGFVLRQKDEVGQHNVLQKKNISDIQQDDVV
jgi:hypothetical protein